MSNLTNISPTLPLNGLNTVLKSAANLGAPPRRRLARKHVLDLLEGLAGRFGVEEEDMDGNDGAKRSKNHVRLPRYVRERRGDEHCKGQIEDPVSSSSDSDTLGSVRYGEDLGGIDPSHRGLLCVWLATNACVGLVQNPTWTTRENSPRSLRRLQRKYSNTQ